MSNDPLRELRAAVKDCLAAGVGPALVTAEVGAALRLPVDDDDPLRPDAFTQLVEMLPGIEPEQRADLAAALRGDVDRIANERIDAATLRKAESHRRQAEQIRTEIEEAAEARRVAAGTVADPFPHAAVRAR